MENGINLCRGISPRANFRVPEHILWLKTEETRHTIFRILWKIHSPHNSQAILTLLQLSCWLWSQTPPLLSSPTAECNEPSFFYKILHTRTWSQDNVQCSMLELISVNTLRTMMKINQCLYLNNRRRGPGWTNPIVFLIVCDRMFAHCRGRDGSRISYRKRASRWNLAMFWPVLFFHVDASSTCTIYRGWKVE